MQSDDAIASLMDEMRAQQGYVPSSSNQAMGQSEKATTKSSSGSMGVPHSSSYQRLLPELDGYPDHEHLAGNQSIWNASVAPNESTVSTNQNNSSYDLPTNPQVEVVRRRAFEKFKQECTEVLQQNTQKWGIKLPIPAMLEKWHMDAKLAEWQERKQRNKGGKKDKTSIDFSGELPLIASTEDVYRWAISAGQKHSRSCFRDPILLSQRASSLFKSILEPEVKKAWAANLSSQPSSNKTSSPLPPKFSKKAEQIQKALYRCICQAIEHFHLQLSQAVKLEMQQSHHNRKRRKLPKMTRDEEKDQYRVTHAGITLSVHAAYFEKLQRLYDRTQVARRASERYPSEEAYVFEEALFCLLCRYDMLQGAGLQAGVPGRVMDTLLNHFDCRMECFASPLNCRYDRFTSAFDVDRTFGGRGSFFDLDDEFFESGGCYQANPPFCEGVIDAMNSRIHDLLEANTTNALMFAVFVPSWKDSKAYREGLLENSFLVKHVLLPNSKHFYAEGTQHRRKGSFRPASFDTSILFYQNDAAKTGWPISEMALADLTRAFCDDPGNMDKTSATRNVTPSRKPSALSQPESKHETTASVDTLVSDITRGQEETKSIKSQNQDKNTNKKKKTGKKAKAKPEKKRQWSDTNEESKAQISLLQSLGLSADAAVSRDEPVSSSVGFSKNKSSTKRRKRR